MGMGEEESSLDAWLDRHHVNIIQLQATSLDGSVLGKYISRDKFSRSLPASFTIADVTLAWDIGGTPYVGSWHDYRKSSFGDIRFRPDISTLVSDGKDPNLGHCIVDFVDEDNNLISIAPRSQLKQAVNKLAATGLEARTAFELEFFLFCESFEEARLKGYRDLVPMGSSNAPIGYLNRNAYHCRDFMNEVIHRLDWKGIAWEAWNDEIAPGQLELNLKPADPITSADRVIRTKEIIHEVAMDMGHSVTFMAKPTSRYGSGMHVHHSLTKDGQSVMFDPDAPDGKSVLFKHWLGGLVATLPAAVSLQCPTINSYRRLTEFNAVPTTITWGEENRTTGLRTITTNPANTRVENRLGSADLNPYLALTTILAGGIAGLNHKLDPGNPIQGMAWGLPKDFQRLPDNISSAADALSKDSLLAETMGEDFVKYWIRSRRWEWLMYNTRGGDPGATKVTDWELSRYFEIV
jgi:glutamine synthetase